jgi:hypothetical protein
MSLDDDALPLGYGLVPGPILDKAKLTGAVQPDGGAREPQRVYAVMLDDSLHMIFATREAADDYCRNRLGPDDEYEVARWAVK